MNGPHWPSTAKDNGTSSGWTPTPYPAGTAGWERYWRERMREARVVFRGQMAEAPGVPFKLRTQCELATLCGVGHSTFRDWEAGRRKAPRVVFEFMTWALRRNDAVFRAAVRRAKARRYGTR